MDVIRNKLSIKIKKDWRRLNPINNQDAIKDNVEKRVDRVSNKGDNDTYNYHI